MSKIFIFFGMSGAGKSTAVSLVKSLGAKSSTFNPVVISKYTTREQRIHEDSEIINVQALPSICDVRYLNYGAMYGFSMEEIVDALSNNKVPIVIINNIWCVEKLKEFFGDIVHTVFLFRSFPDLKKLTQLGIERGTPEVMKTRYEKAKGILNLYKERLKFFQSFVLNVKDTKFLEIQLKNLLYKDLRTIYTPKIYIISGTHVSGKDDILQMTYDLNLKEIQCGMKYIADSDEKEIQCMSKYTTRNKRENDRQELIFTTQEDIYNKCDIIYENYGNLYGIDSKLIWDNIRKGRKTIISVTNEKAIKMLCNIFGSIVKLIFVYSESRDQLEIENLEEYTKRRKNDYTEVLDIYANNLNIFSHVVLNTGNKEDMFEQVHRIFLDKE